MSYRLELKANSFWTLSRVGVLPICMIQKENIISPGRSSCSCKGVSKCVCFRDDRRERTVWSNLISVTIAIAYDENGNSQYRLYSQNTVWQIKITRADAMRYYIVVYITTAAMTFSAKRLEKHVRIVYLSSFP